MPYVSTEKWRERRWRLFLTDPIGLTNPMAPKISINPIKRAHVMHFSLIPGMLAVPVCVLGPA